MSTYRVIALAIVSAALSIIVTIQFINSADTTTQTPQFTTEKTLTLESQKEPETNADSNRLKQEAITQKQQLSTQQPDSLNNQYTKLVDEASINAFFVNEQGTLDGAALTHVLTVGMADFIEQTSSANTNSELAINRQEKLNQQLIALKDLAIYEQHTVCSGRICALSLITNELTAKNKKLIQEFDSNISFVNTSESTTGEVEFKAIYLHSEDPSQLLMTQP